MTADHKRFKRNWQGEVDAAWTYRLLAQLETQPQLVEIYQRMAEIEAKHARFWSDKLSEAGVNVGEEKPTLRTRIMGFIARRFGPQVVLQTLSAVEQTASHGYDDQREADGTGMAADEHSHARVLKVMADDPNIGMEGGSLARLEGRHRSVGGNALRAAVLGANDGLCSTLSLVMGVAGASLDSRAPMVAGIAGLLAGACAMAMGEWLSVQSARELAQKQLAIESDELANNPEEEEQELSLIYQAKGLDKEEADKLAAKLIGDPNTALQTLSREELGLDPDDLGGSAWEAAITSFFLFIAGALSPVLPFIFWQGQRAMLLSIILSGIALFAIGAGITLLTGRSIWFSGLRQLVIGFSAAAVTYGIGHLVGIAID